MSSTAASASGSSRQNAAPNRSHRSPERPPRGGKSRRTLIESACTACQKRKSRVCPNRPHVDHVKSTHADYYLVRWTAVSVGSARCMRLVAICSESDYLSRPACSRCQALHTECGYNAEEGESRWSALRRRNRTLERERDEARDLIAQLHSRPELEAQEIFHRLRTTSHSDNLGAFIHEAVSAMSDSDMQQQSHSEQQQGQMGQHFQPYYTERPGQHQQLTQQHQPQQQLQQSAQRQQPSQQQDQGIFVQPNYNTTTSATQLPPLRSVVEVPTGGHNTAPLPQPFPPSARRNPSQVSAMSSGSYTSLSSSDGRGGQSLSPRENPPHKWTQGPQQ